MAVFKQSEDFLPLSGKIGGQSLANTKGPGTIRTITQTNTAGTVLQRSQRFTTFYFAAKYMALHPQFKADWSVASLDYFYIANDSSLTQRTGYGTFLYINQNRFLIGLPLLLEPPVYTPVYTPAITTNIDNNNKLTITTPDRKLNQTYAIFANIAIGLGATMKPGLGYFCGTISQTELDDGVNILPMILARFPGTLGKINIGFYLSAIAADNGNRDQFPEMNNQITIITNALLNVDVTSYYPFNDNFNDHYDVNNPSSTKETTLSTGLVSGAAKFIEYSQTKIYIPYSESLDFNFPAINTPKSVCLWYTIENNSLAQLIHNQPTPPPADVGQFRINANYGLALAYMRQSSPTESLELITNISKPVNTWRFIGVSYSNPDNFLLIFDDNVNTTPIPNPNFQHPTIKKFGWAIGGNPYYSFKSFAGKICELTFFNQALTAEQFETIRQANLNGKTILDINQ